MGVGVAGTVAEVVGTAGTEEGIMDTDIIVLDITDTTGVGVGLPADTIRGGCFPCRCPTRITGTTVPVMDMGMGTDLAMGTDTDIDKRILNKRLPCLDRDNDVNSSPYRMTLWRDS